MEKERNELFMNLRTDYAFKRLFGSPENAHLLLLLLNSLSLVNTEITEVTFKDKEVLPPDKDGKRMVYDIYCTTRKNQHFILEMQNIYEPYFENRAVLYAIRGLSDQVKRGGEYYLDPVYAIFFTNFDFDHMRKGIPHSVGLMDTETHELFTPVLNMRFIPMSSVRKSWEECINKNEKILYLLKNMHTLDKNSKPYTSGEYNEFFEAAEINRLAAEEMVAYSQSYAKMEETERAISYAVDRASKESYSEGFSEGESVGFSKGESVGFSKGESVGFSKGESVGVSKGIRDTALNFKILGVDFQTISQATGLTIEEIESL